MIEACRSFSIHVAEQVFRLIAMGTVYCNRYKFVRKTFLQKFLVLIRIFNLKTQESYRIKVEKFIRYNITYYY